MPISKPRPAILITGGAQRLGLALAQCSIAEGYDVIIHYRTTNADAQKWLDKNPTLCAHVTFICGELTTHGPQIVQTAVSTHGNLVGLILNASEFTLGNLRTIEHFEAILENNTLAPLRCADAFNSIVKKGFIIGMTDAHVSHPHPKFQNYRISKLFFAHLLEQLAFTYAPNIRVNAIAPGALLAAPSEHEAEHKALVKSAPIPLQSALQSLTDAYTYLISHKWITGQTLYVDGGWHLQ